MSTPTTRKKVLISECIEFLDMARDSVLHTSQLDPLITTSMEETLALTRQWKPDILILGPQDVAPLCETLKSQEGYRSIPLIAMMDRHDEESKDRVFFSGADEWLSFPMVEKVALARLQELTGVRFRKLPRFFYTAPATVSFKGKDFSATSIDFNRSMIFLETEEGLAPTTGRNVKIKFKLSEGETIFCWGRVMRLMSRQVPKEGKEAIGMLIRFLDLPELIADRIEFLAISQSEHFLEPENAASVPQFFWHDYPFYERVCLALCADAVKSDDVDIAKLTLPFSIAQIHMRNLSILEKECLSGLSPDPLLKKSVVIRFKLLDELHKLRKGAGPQHATLSLTEGQALKSEIQTKINELIIGNRGDDLLDWSRIKFDLIRSLIEMDFICRRRTTLKSLYEKKNEFKGAAPSSSRHKGHDWKIPILAFLAICLAVALFLSHFQNAPVSSRLREISPNQWGVLGNHLINAQVIRLGVGQHAIASGVLGSTWEGLAPDEKQILLRDLTDRLKGDHVKGFYLFDVNGKLVVSFQNDQITTH